jgi:hypothetical protein
VDRHPWWTVVNTVMNLLCPQTAVNLLTVWCVVSFWDGTLLLGVCLRHIANAVIKMWCLSPVHRAFDVTGRITTCHMGLFTDHFTFLKRLCVWESFFLPAVALEVRCSITTVVWKICRLKPCGVVAVEKARVCFNSTWNCMRTFFLYFVQWPKNGQLTIITLLHVSTLLYHPQGARS